MSAPPSRAARRRATHGRGLAAERLALLLLVLKGYRVLARRHRAGGGEVDLVVRRGRAVAFVEVKARPTLDEAAAALTPRQMRRVAAAARHWLAGPGRGAMGLDLRLDAVLVAPRRLPRHLVAVADLDLG